MTCTKTQGFLESIGCTARETVDANKVKFGPVEALALLTGAETLVAMKGKKVVLFDLKRDRPDDTTLVSHLIGPTGNLRAPTAKVGTTVLVGFNEDAYREHLA